MFGKTIRFHKVLNKKDCCQILIEKVKKKIKHIQKQDFFNRFLFEKASVLTKIVKK